MECDALFGLVAGVGIGLLMSQILLVFFMDEIFAGIDWLRRKIRGIFGLNA